MKKNFLSDDGIFVGMYEKIARILRVEANGSLPELVLTFPSEHQRRKLLRKVLSTGSVTPNSTIYHGGKDLRCNQMSANELAMKLQTGHRINVVDHGSLPELGVSLYDGQIAFDFETGSDWTDSVVSDLVALLIEARQLGAVEIELDEEGILFAKSDRKAFKASIELLLVGTKLF